jgi:hypothetical protein
MLRVVVLVRLDVILDLLSCSSILVTLSLSISDCVETVLQTHIPLFCSVSDLLQIQGVNYECYRRAPDSGRFYRIRLEDGVRLIPSVSTHSPSYRYEKARELHLNITELEATLTQEADLKDAEFRRLNRQKKKLYQFQHFHDTLKRLRG